MKLVTQVIQSKLLLLLFFFFYVTPMEANTLLRDCVAKGHKISAEHLAQYSSDNTAGVQDHGRLDGYVLYKMCLKTVACTRH